jgi:hypothetical protein
MSPSGSSNAPEAKARTRIDQALAESGWTLQDRDDMNLAAARAIAVREFKLDKGHRYVDYMLVLDGHPEVGAIDLRVVRQLARPVDGEARVTDASNTGVELLPGFRLLRSTAFVVHITVVAELPIQGRPPELLAVHAGPAVPLEDIPAAFREDDQCAVVADGRDGLDEP